MSFKDKIKFELKNIRYVDRLNFENSADGCSAEIDVRKAFSNYMYEYQIGFYFVQSGNIYKEEADIIQQNFYESLKREIYEEIREKIIKLERFYYERDKEGIENTINEIKREVF